MGRSDRLMAKYIDLSHDIIDGMPIYPGDGPVKLYQEKFLEGDEYNSFRLEIGMHAGTHIDTPMHLTNSKITIDKIALDTFVGQGCLLDVRNEDIIKYKEEYLDKVSENDIVLLYTNYDYKYGTEEYYTKHPVIAKELADFFIHKKIKMIGIDFPSPDRYPFEIHKKLFEHVILIIENLTNLWKLLYVDKFEVIAFPLKIKAEASMVRVVAKI